MKIGASPRDPDAGQAACIRFWRRLGVGTRRVHGRFHLRACSAPGTFCPAIRASVLAECPSDRIPWPLFIPEHATQPRHLPAEVARAGCEWRIMRAACGTPNPAAAARPVSETVPPRPLAGRVPEDRLTGTHSGRLGSRNAPAEIFVAKQGLLPLYTSSVSRQAAVRADNAVAGNQDG